MIKSKEQFDTFLLKIYDEIVGNLKPHDETKLENDFFEALENLLYHYFEIPDHQNYN